MRGICSNMLRLQADTERLQEDFNSLHAREDDQAHIAVGATGLRGRIPRTRASASMCGIPSLSGRGVCPTVRPPHLPVLSGACWQTAAAGALPLGVLSRVLIQPRVPSTTVAHCSLGRINLAASLPLFIMLIMLQVKAVLGKAEEVLTRPKSPSAAELERLGGEMAALQAIVASMGATVREHRCGWIFAAVGMRDGSATGC